jgi:hypothetical protein
MLIIQSCSLMIPLISQDPLKSNLEMNNPVILGDLIY